MIFFPIDNLTMFSLPKSLIVYYFFFVNNSFIINFNSFISKNSSNFAFRQRDPVLKNQIQQYSIPFSIKFLKTFFSGMFLPKKSG